MGIKGTLTKSAHVTKLKEMDTTLNKHETLKKKRQAEMNRVELKREFLRWDN